MYFAETRDSLIQMTWMWAGLFLILLLISWQSKRGSVGLVMAYGFALSLIHFSGALPYCTASYRPLNQVLLDNHSGFHPTFLGFEQALIGMVAFVLGCVAAQVMVKERVVVPPTVLRRENQKLPGTLVLLSIVILFVLWPIAKLVPSLGSLGASGTGLSMVGASLSTWNAKLLGNRSKIYKVLIISAIAFPGTTLIFFGFTAIGVAYAATVWTFVMTFLRPRWLNVVFLCSFTYLGYSVYVNYLRERTAIRDSVWGQQSISARVDSAAEMLRKWEFFNMSKHHHLEALDLRLNQNHLVGMGVEYLSSGRQSFAQGSTLAVALTAWVPRILWPGKPSTAGSGGIVSRFTGMSFPAGTSVGVGHIFEYYINFGTKGVFWGLLFIGLALRWIDLRASEFLRAGDYAGFMRWFIPAFGILNIAGTQATLVASVAAGIVFTRLMDRTILIIYNEDHARSRDASTPMMTARRGSARA